MKMLRVWALALSALSLAACSPTQLAGQAETKVQSEAARVRQLVQSHLPGGGVDTATQTALQLVIQRGDFEQEQAIASKDSSVMKDTSTDAYFQQAAQANQDLLDSGVTSIKLVNVEWGAISLNGDTATVNNYETWSSTYADGTTDQSRDHNVYTLVKQNGQWKIQADDQPDSGGPPPAASPQPRASSAPTGRGRPGAQGASPSGRAQPSPAGSPVPGSSGPLSIAAQQGSPEAAVQQVILRGNQEQEQAISSKNSSVMKDTSTDAYYQELTQDNQDMLDSGVTAIKLLKIEWGNVSISGNRATATTWETWSSEYDDGTTDQSRDQNDYTLVQQNGQWKIDSDDHPDEGLIPGPGGTQPSSGSGSPSPSVPPAPRLPRGRGTSSNWSGYAATGGKFTAVSGTWTVPQPDTTGSLGADAAWVGIGGANSRDLLQAGTEETVLASGRTHFDAWIEMLPQVSHPVQLAIHPGDSVTVSIEQQQSGDWQVSFKNNTTGANYQRTVQYNSSMSSAEWIEEAPSGGRGGIMPIDNFGTVTFSGASAVKDGQTVNLTQAGAQPITMINRNNQPLVTPSAITGDGAGFTVSRTGNTATTGGGGFRVR